MSKIVSFRQMQHGTREDYLLLDESERRYAEGLADRVLEGLRKLDHCLFGYRVSRLQHSLQTATRAQRDGAGASVDRASATASRRAAPREACSPSGGSAAAALNIAAASVGAHP